MAAPAPCAHSAGREAARAGDMVFKRLLNLWPDQANKKAEKQHWQRPAAWRAQAKGMQRNPSVELFGDAGDVGLLVARLSALPQMDKVTMSGKCIDQTKAMEQFMQAQVGMCTLRGKFFVPGVRAFELSVPVHSLPPDRQLEFGRFKMSVAEVIEWQRSFCVYCAADLFQGDQGMKVLQRCLAGRSKPGLEAWMMKFAVRISQNPVLMRFDGKVIGRSEGEAAAERIYLVSVCGIDFAARAHDFADITGYITNWREVFQLDEDGNPIVVRGRDFVRTGKQAKLNVLRCMQDLRKMARLRLRAQDDMGIQVVVEVGLGLGVFAGDAIGIGEAVRTLSALAIKQVLEEEAFNTIKLVVFSLPVFRAGDNYAYFSRAFGSSENPYTGSTPVLIMDQDMHAIALAAAEAGYTVGELNPADSHGVFGEYWQNMGPGTEEKLALTTCGLLTQHHAVNPAVLDTSRYFAMDVSEATPQGEL